MKRAAIRFIWIWLFMVMCGVPPWAAIFTGLNGLMFFYLEEPIKTDPYGFYHVRRDLMNLDNRFK